MSVVVGIDPGKTGGVAAVSGLNELVLFEHLPIIELTKGLAIVDGQKLYEFITAQDPFDYPHVVIERVSAMPGQGVASTFNFGVMFGSILAALHTQGISFEFVTPQRWKKAAGIQRPKASVNDKKKAALGRFQQLFPRQPARMKDMGPVEAALIAFYSDVRSR